MIETILAGMGMLVLLGFLTESATEVIKTMFNTDGKLTYIISILIALVLGFALNVNIFGLTGYWYYVSVAFSALMASRGANYIHGFAKNLGIIKSLKE